MKASQGKTRLRKSKIGYRVKEVADMLGCRKETVYKRIYRGELPAFYISGTLYVEPDFLEQVKRKPRGLPARIE